MSRHVRYSYLEVKHVIFSSRNQKLQVMDRWDELCRDGAGEAGGHGGWQHPHGLSAQPLGDQDQPGRDDHLPGWLRPLLQDPPGLALPAAPGVVHLSRDRGGGGPENISRRLQVSVRSILYLSIFLFSSNLLKEQVQVQFVCFFDSRSIYFYNLISVSVLWGDWYSCSTEEKQVSINTNSRI